MQACELTHVTRSPIDMQLATSQHGNTARPCALGVAVVTLSDNRHLPDCTFIEDTAVVLDEVAIITPMGTESRCGASRDRGEACKISSGGLNCAAGKAGRGRHAAH